MTTHHDPRACDCTLHTATPQVCPDPLDEEALFWHERWHEAADQRDARDAAAYAWKEAARRLAIRVRSMNAVNKAWDANFTAAIKQRDDAWTQLEATDRDLATADAQRDEAQSLAAEQIAEAQTESTDAVTRAETAEWERDNAHHSRDLWLKERDEERARADAAERHRGKWREAATLWEKRAIKAENRLDDLHTTQPRPLTAREHLEAAWKAAYVPEGDVIHAGEAFILRDEDGDVATSLDGTHIDLPVSQDSMKRRLLDPPPKRPEGAEELARLIATSDVGEWDCGDLADYLLSTGRVHVTGGEEA